jgi:hypothetical protein
MKRPSWSSWTNSGMRNCWSMSRSQLRERSQWQYCVLQYCMHQTCSVLLHYDSWKCCVYPPYKFIYSFKVVKLFLEHPLFIRVRSISAHQWYIGIWEAESNYDSPRNAEEIGEEFQQYQMAALSGFWLNARSGRYCLHKADWSLRIFIF